MESSEVMSRVRVEMLDRPWLERVVTASSPREGDLEHKRTWISG